MVDYSKLSNEDLINLKNGNYANISNEGLLLLKGSSQTDNKPVKQNKGVDLTPSGIMRQISVAPISAIDSLITRKPFKEAQEKRVQWAKEIDDSSILGKTKNFLTDALVYSYLPQARLAKGANLVTGLGQGAVIGGLEGLKREGAQGILPGVGSGALLGGTLTAGLPVVGNVVSQGVKILPQAGGLLSKTFGRVKPETLEQAVKPNSRALDLTEKDAQNLLMNTTERIQKDYKSLLADRGQAVNDAIKALPKNEGVPITNLRNSLDDIYNSYSVSGNPELNVAYNEAGGLYNRINEMLNKTDKTGALRAEIEKQLNMPKTAQSIYNKQAEDEAFDILHNATGKNTRWLKSQLKSDSNARGMDKRKEFIENALDKTDDRLDLNAAKGQYSNYDTSGLTWENQFGSENIGKGEEIARQALSDIQRGNFNMDYLSPLERDIAKADDAYFTLMKRTLNSPKPVDNYAQVTDNFLNIIKDFPEDVQASYLNRFDNDLTKLANFKNYEANPTTSPAEIKEILKNITEKEPKNLWGKPADTVENQIVKRLYGQYNSALSDLSPELQMANQKYAALKNFENNEGISNILFPKALNAENKLDTASRTLRNYNSTVTKGNTNRNIQDLERILVANGKKPFLNDIDDVNAAMDLLNVRGTGDSWLANMATQATRPVLRGARAFNRFSLDRNLPELFDAIGEPLPRLFTPVLYGGGSSLFD